MFLYLETDSGNITDGVTFATESSNQDLVVLLNVVERTVTGHERGDLLAVLDQLHTHALADGRVRLLSFDSTAKKKDGSRLLTGGFGNLYINIKKKKQTFNYK